MSNISNANDILIALAHLEDELPTLVGEEQWNVIESTFQAQVTQLQQTSDAAQRERLSQELLDMLASSEAASERLKHKVWSVRVLRQLMEEALVSEMGFDPTEIGDNVDFALLTMSPELSIKDEVPQRHIIMPIGGVGGAVSISWRHIQRNVGKTAEFAAATVMTGSDIASNPHPLIMTAGMLLAIRSLYNAVTVKISETEASVFWGFILARNEQNIATEAQIIKETNYQREKREFEALAPKQVRRALYNLRSMKSVEKVAGQPKMWKMIENFNIRG